MKEAAERILDVLLAASKDAQLGAFVFVPAREVTNHVGGTRASERKRRTSSKKQS